MIRWTGQLEVSKYDEKINWKESEKFEQWEIEKEFESLEI